MSYRLEPQETVAVGIRRVARERLDQAIDEFEGNAIDRHETVHQVRKYCKNCAGRSIWSDPVGRRPPDRRGDYCPAWQGIEVARID